MDTINFYFKVNEAYFDWSLEFKALFDDCWQLKYVISTFSGLKQAWFSLKVVSWHSFLLHL